MTNAVHAYLNIRCKPFLLAIALAIALAVAALLPVTVHAAATPVIATGTVTDAVTGLPIEGAEVWLGRYDPAWDEWELVGIAGTDASGAYTLHDEYAFGAGEYRAEVWAFGYVVQTHTGNWNGMAPLTFNFSLQPAKIIATGTVTDVVSGLPIEGAGVLLERFDPVMGEWELVGITGTDALGTYTLHDERALGAGEYDFMVGAFGYITQIQTGNWDGVTPLALDFALEPAPTSISIEGLNRFATAVAASKEAFPDGLDPDGPLTVVIATGRNWPDALGGAALAGALGGPVLLVDTGSIPAAVSAEITRLGATRAVILGGTGAVGTSVEGALKTSLGANNVTRIGGADRYATANLIAAEVRKVLGVFWDGDVFVATGGNFPDALAAAPAAAAQGIPLYLAHPAAGLSQATRNAMADASSAVILGGTGVVSAGTEDYLVSLLGSESVTRLAGKNRYDTSVKVAQWTVDTQGHTWDRAGITTGLDFPDALAGGVLQGNFGSVMLLTRPGVLDSDTRAALEANKALIHTLTFFGGKGAVSEAVRAAALSAAE